MKTSCTRVRRTCDYHLKKSKLYRAQPKQREKNKKYMQEYYKNKASRWSEYRWKKKKLETVLKIQQIPYARIESISDDYETIVIKLENPKPPVNENNPSSVPPSPQTPPDSPSTPRRNLCNLFDTPANHP